MMELLFQLAPRGPGRSPSLIPPKPDDSPTTTSVLPIISLGNSPRPEWPHTLGGRLAKLRSRDLIGHVTSWLTFQAVLVVEYKYLDNLKRAEIESRKIFDNI